MSHDTLPTVEKPKFESAVEFKDAESQQATMADLIAFAAEWTAKNRDYIEDYTKRMGIAPGPKLKDLEGFVTKVAPGLNEEAATLQATRLFNDAMRFNHDLPMPEDRSRLDQTSETAMVGQGELAKYGIHMMKESGLPFDGEAAEGVEESLKAQYTALGYDVDNDPGAQLNIKEILETE